MRKEYKIWLLALILVILFRCNIPFTVDHKAGCFGGTVVAALGGWLDMRTGRIPNKLTIRALGAGLLFHIALGGCAGAFGSLGGIGLAAVFIIFWLLGALKAGDIKLYMAVGAWGQWEFIFWTFVYSILVAGIVSTVKILKRKDRLAPFKRLWTWCMLLILTRKFQRYEPDDAESYIRFGPCIALGAMAALVMSGGMLS